MSIRIKIKSPVRRCYRRWGSVINSPLVPGFQPAPAPSQPPTAPAVTPTPKYKSKS